MLISHPNPLMTCTYIHLKHLGTIASCIPIRCYLIAISMHLFYTWSLWVSVGSWITAGFSSGYLISMILEITIYITKDLISTMHFPFHTWISYTTHGKWRLAWRRSYLPRSSYIHICTCTLLSTFQLLSFKVYWFFIHLYFTTTSAFTVYYYYYYYLDY